MFCKTCGAQLNDNQVICLNCGCAKGTGIKYCANCGNELMPDAAACMNCGVASDFDAEKAKRNTGITGIDNGWWCPADKDKIAAILLAFFLGSFGVHNFYLGETKKGTLRLCLCWCGVGSILAFIDFIKMLTGSYTISAEKSVQQEKEMTKRCPFCHKEIFDQAVFCVHCSKALTDPRQNIKDKEKNTALIVTGTVLLLSLITLGISGIQYLDYGDSEYIIAPIGSILCLLAGIINMLLTNNQTNSFKKTIIINGFIFVVLVISFIFIFIV